MKAGRAQHRAWHTVGPKKNFLLLLLVLLYLSTGVPTLVSLVITMMMTVMMMGIIDAVFIMC